MTYLALNAAFLVVPLALAAFAVLRIRRAARGPGSLLPAAALGLAAVLLLTLVFDNVLVGIGIVDYDESAIIGVRLGVAPIEDFAYAIAAAVGLPSLWILLRREHR